MSKKTFVCSDESVNCYGFRVLTAGIQLGNFKKNPVMFFNHDTGGGFWYRDPNYTGPLGRWENVKKENGELRADAVFDTNDAKGKVLNDKVENDFIRAASIGFRVIETSNDPALMEKGQTYPTITKCELLEISVCDIPANKNALALFDADGNRINLDDSRQLQVALSATTPQQPIIPQNKMKLKLNASLKALATFFGLEAGKDHEIETTPEKLEELNSKLTGVKALEDEIASLKAAASTQSTDLQAVKDQLKASQDEVAALKKQPDQEPGKAAGEPEKKETAGITGVDKALADAMNFSFENSHLSKEDLAQAK